MFAQHFSYLHCVKHAVVYIIFRYLNIQEDESLQRRPGRKILDSFDEDIIQRIVRKSFADNDYITCRSLLGKEIYLKNITVNKTFWDKLSNFFHKLQMLKTCFLSKFLTIDNYLFSCFFYKYNVGYCLHLKCIYLIIFNAVMKKYIYKSYNLYFDF